MILSIIKWSNRAAQMFVLMLLFALQSCKRNDSSTIVAHFGDESISLKEFKIAYLEMLKQPDKFDSHQMRRDFMDELINRKLLTQEARERKMDSDERLQMHIQAFKNKCLRDAHYDKKIKPQVNISDSLLREIYLYMRETREIKHLYFEAETGAERAYGALQNGADWDTLAGKIFTDSSLNHNGGDLGWVHWDQMEYDMAMTSFRLPINNYSKPVKSSFGWHILKCTGFKKVPFIAENDYQKRRTKILRLAESSIGDKLARRYVEKLMQKPHIKINPKAMRTVGEKLVRILRHQPSVKDKSRLIQLDPEQQASLENMLWDLRNETLVYIDSDVLTVGDFVSNLTYVPCNAIYSSYKKALDYVIRDACITKEARDMGLEDDEDVRIRTRIFEEYLLSTRMRAALQNEISISDADLENEYYKLIKNKNIPRQDWHKFKKGLQNQVRIEKRIAAISAFLKKAKKRMIIILDLKPIDDYYNQFLVGKSKMSGSAK